MGVKIQKADQAIRYFISAPRSVHKPTGGLS